MFSWFLNIKLQNKIRLSFMLVTLVLLLVILVIIQMIKDMEQVTRRVINMRTPTTQASHMLLNGVNHSLASLRAWIILGEDHFKLERKNAWGQQIDPSMKKMLELSREWTEPHNVELLNNIKAQLEKFRHYQEEIEAIAQTEENVPANKILFEQVAPLERSVLNQITRMIKLELKRPPDPKRKDLAALLTDLEISAGVTLERIEEYLLSGSPEFKGQFEHHWSRNSELFTLLSSKNPLFIPEQKELLQNVAELRSQMGPLLKKVIDIRSSDQWNQAHFMLKDKAAPIAASITRSLNEMIESQNSLLQDDHKEVSRRTHLLIVILVGWFIVGGLISGILGSTISRGISVPLQSADNILIELAQGNFRHDPIPTKSGDELGMLVTHSNELVKRLRDFRRHATNLLSGNVKHQEFDLEGEYKRILDEILKMVKSQDPPPSSGS